MQHILVPTNFSPEAHNAFEVALQLAHRTGGHITLLHVLSGITGNGGMVTTGGRTGGGNLDDLFMVQMLQLTKRRMHQLMGEAGKTTPDVTVVDMIETGDIDEAVLDVVRRRQIDLVVVGAHEHTPGRHLFGADSHAESLVRRAPCPVLTVKHPAPQFEAHTIVFASNFDPEADRAVPTLRQLRAAFPEATLRLLDIAPDANSRVAAMARIQAYADRHALTGYEIAVPEEAQVPSGIQHYAEATHADIVVMLSHGHTNMWHLWQGGIAERVAVQAAPPVLTFHPWDQGGMGAPARHES